MNQEFNSDREKLMTRLRRDIQNEQVIRAIERVPRELFVPSLSQHLAYADIPLPIDKGQTISQPYIVALMTEALELDGTERVLEVGTGSGYQAAILAELAQQVVSVERHQGLIDAASQTLKSLGYRNIQIHPAQETLGWPPQAPYNAIIVTAGAPQVPRTLLDQLAEEGRLVIPVGSRYEQQLLQIIKWKGQLITHDLGGCRFVPLIAEDAWEENSNPFPK